MTQNRATRQTRRFSGGFWRVVLKPPSFKRPKNAESKNSRWRCRNCPKGPSFAKRVFQLFKDSPQLLKSLFAHSKLHCFSQMTAFFCVNLQRDSDWNAQNMDHRQHKFFLHFFCRSSVMSLEPIQKWSQDSEKSRACSPFSRNACFESFDLSKGPKTQEVKIRRKLLEASCNIFEESAFAPRPFQSNKKKQNAKICGSSKPQMAQHA